MAGIGEDIKEVLGELGTPFTIYKPDGSVITGEYLDFEHYFEQSTEFIRQNVYAADLTFDTQVAFGDVLDIDGLWVIVMNLKPTKFEQELVIKNCFLIETNCLGHFSRRSETLVNMEPDVTWTPTVQNVRALQLDDYRSPISSLGENNELPTVQEILYVSKYDNIRIGDRWFPDSGNTDEYYRIANFSDRVYQNLLRINLVKDTRE